LKRSFAKAIAPGQSNELICQVLHSDKEDSEEEPVPEDLTFPLKMFKESDSMGQIFILAIIDQTKYTKETLIKMLQCQRHRCGEFFVE